MVHPFRSALLVVAALTASTVAPAQVRQASAVATPQQLSTSGTNPLLVPAVLAATPELPTFPDPLAPTDTQPVEQEEAPVPTGDLASMVAELSSSEPGSKQLECLAGAIYFESKSESLKGQLAVGHVIANRASSGRFPSTYCGVVYQRSQFSFVRGGSMPPIARSGKQWKTAVAIAKIVDQELQPAPVAKALFFHARRVSPGWRLTRIATLGNHVFYR
ncbi:MAG: cell wall hydrolase [Pseudomonadota bacterium]|nr:cell wall hydrolase [Pseudomonadota bacterium]